MILRDGGKIISDTEKVANTFFKQFLVETNDVFDHVLKPIKKYSTHPSIPSINEKMNNNLLSFWKVTYEEIINEINSFNTLKSRQSEDIPFKIIKDFCQFYLTKL